MCRYMRIATLLCFAYGATPVLAQGLYKWVDSRGGIHYTNTPTNNNAKTVDDALPPASNFKNLAPPSEPTRPTTDTTKDNAPASEKGTDDRASDQTQNAAAPSEQPQATDQ